MRPLVTILVVRFLRPKNTWITSAKPAAQDLKVLDQLPVILNYLKTDITGAA